jgi:hypothetical protein
MATITISNTGGNFNATGTWVGGVVPGVADNVVATATSGPLTVTNSPTIISINFTNYTNTFSVNSGFTLTLTGGITMVAGMSVSPSSTGTLAFNASTSITSGGQVWPGNLVFSLTGNRAYTLGDPWVVNGNVSVSFSNTGLTCTFVSNQMSIKGNFIVGSNASATNSTVTGSTVIVLATDTSQTITSNITLPSVRMLCSLVISATGTVIFSTPIAAIRLGNVTYTAGEVVSVGATLENFGGTTFTTSLMTWDCTWDFNSTAQIFTFGSDFNISNLGTLELFNGSGSFTLNGNNINLYGDLIMTFNFGGNIVGTTIMNFLGDCTISQESGMQLRLPIVINSSGTVTFSTDFVHGNTLTYTAGNFSMSTALTWSVIVSTTYTFNSPGFSFPNFVTFLTHTFAGAYGCDFYSYSISTTTAGINQIFQSTNTYNITNSLNLLGTAANTLTFRSSSSGSRAIVTLYYGASMEVGHVTATDIDSSGGQTVWNYKGTISNTLNWQALPIIPKTIGVPWVR